MSYNDMLNTFTTLLDRDDCTPAQAAVFLGQGIARIQRTARLPSMERAQLITPTSVSMVQFPVPPDLLQIMDILVPRLNDTAGQRMTALQHVSYRALMRYDVNDYPKAYARSQTMIYVRGAIPVGVQLQFLYFGNFSTFATADSENELSASSPDLGVYAALKYAADFFEHPNAVAWETTYQSILAEVIQMGRDLDNEGGVNEVQPLYHWDDCE